METNNTTKCSSSRPVSRARRLLIGALFALVTPMVVSSGTAAAATYTVSGVVTCASGGNVQGVWIESSAGGSTWADWWAMPGRPTSAYFSKTISFSGTATNVSLHTGCGRNANGSWFSTNLTPVIAVGSQRVLNMVCAPSAGGGRAQTCSWAPGGPTSTYNMGYAGYCTYGAYELWKQAVGAFPSIGGNAIQMDDNAAAKGFRVTDVPQARSMIVWNTGTYGHVAWVTSIAKNSLGQVVVYYTDMNGGAMIDAANGITTDFGKYAARSTIWSPSVQRFIVAKP